MQLKDSKASMLTRKIAIKNKLGLHARAASKLVSVASRFHAEVSLHKEDDLHANAKSIMGLMMLAARHGTELTLTAEGDDANEALDAICELIDRRFDEAE